MHVQRGYRSERIAVRYGTRWLSTGDTMLT